MLKMLATHVLVASCIFAAVESLHIPTPTVFIKRDAESVSQNNAASITPSQSAGSDGYFTTIQHITIEGVTNDHVTIAGQTIDIAIPTCIQTITPDANGYVPPGTCGAIWDYYPNFPAALIFACIFGILTMVHLWQAVVNRKKFCWVIIMASTWETIAFSFRTISTRYQQNTTIYLIFQIFILLSPLWVNAFDYMVLSRMIYYFLRSRSLFSVPATAIAVIFVTLDFVSFVIQVVGGSMAGPTSSAEDQLKAIHIYMGGIGLQQFFIFVFIALAAAFQIEMKRLERVKGEASLSKRNGWKRLLYTLYASLGLITIRIIFRLIEFSRGSDVSNPLLTSEAFFYFLEALPMSLTIFSFNITHPGVILIGPDSEIPGFFSTFKALWHRKSGKRLLQDSDNESIELSTEIQDGRRGTINNIQG
ncbi:RTA1 like domain-containing protein [Trichoderma evansii]